MQTRNFNWNDKFRITAITEPDAKHKPIIGDSKSHLSAFYFLCIPLSLVLDILYKKISVLIFFAVACITVDIPEHLKKYTIKIQYLIIDEVLLQSFK